MSIIKNTPNFLKHSGLGFTTIINQTMDRIKDDGALGLYCYLASKSENFEICQVHLQNRFGKGRDYIRKKIKILKEAGLIKIQPVRDEKGHILYWETWLVNFVDNNITEKPYSSTQDLSTAHITENPTSGKVHLLDKPQLIIKDIIKIKDKSFYASHDKKSKDQKPKPKLASPKPSLKKENEKKHDWAPMKNEQFHIKQSEQFKRSTPPPQLREMINKIKTKGMSGS